MNTTAKGPPKQRLTVERLRRRWTQLEVADQLGTTPGNVSRWERRITSPGPYFRSKLCELFGMSAHELGLTWSASEDLLAQSQTQVGPSTTSPSPRPRQTPDTGALSTIDNMRWLTIRSKSRQPAYTLPATVAGASMLISLLRSFMLASTSLVIPVSNKCRQIVMCHLRSWFPAVSRSRRL